MKQKISSYILLLSVLYVAAQDKFNLGFSSEPRFEVTNIVWPQTIGDASVCLWNDDKLSAFTITIDDNNEQDIPYWQKLQAKYELPYTWFVITEANKKLNVKNWKLFDELSKAGNAIQGHDDQNWYQNPKKSKKNMSNRKYRKRLQRTIASIEKKIPIQKCLTYAYPWGVGNEEVASELFIASRNAVGLLNSANQIDFKQIRSVSNPHIYKNKSSRDKYILPLIDKFSKLEDKNYYRGWGSTHFHHITSDETKTITNEFLNYLKQKEDKLWIGTFTDVAKYAQEYATHSLKVDSVSVNKIHFILTDKMLNEIYNYPLTVKVRLPNNWSNVSANQEDNVIENKVIEYNNNKYTLVKVVPDRGQVILTGDVDLTTPKNNTSSRLEMATLTDYFHIPKTISKEAQDLLKSKTRLVRESGSHFPKGDASPKKWKELQNFVDNLVLEGLEPIKEYYRPSIDTLQIGGVRAIDIKPKNYKKTDKVVFYIHGGAYVVLHADVTLASMLPLAEATGLRIVAIDYTLAPEAKFEQITTEVIQLYKGLLEEYDANDIAMYGDSAGGGLSAGSILKMRDQDVELPAVLVLWSPWTDIDQIGDTYFTLADNDPNLVSRDLLENAALAYAPKSEFKNPYVSPVYGDFTKNFPPTLIQVGSKEIFLSNAIRLYRKLDDANKEVKLDVYEGMWHVWQGHYLLPESKKAIENTKKFMFKYLNY